MHKRISIDVGRHYLAVEYCISVERPGPGHGPAHLDGLVQPQHPVLERVGVGAADEGGPGHAPAPVGVRCRHTEVLLVTVVTGHLNMDIIIVTIYTIGSDIT